MQFDIRRFDIYRKIPKDLTQPTLTGAVISVLSMMFIAYLFISELVYYITPELVSEMYVDDPVTHSERIPVKIDITLPDVECKFIGLDIQDDFGRHEVGFVDDTDKKPINDNQGCQFMAHFKINKVPGNFHISTHASREQPLKPSMKHILNELTFGDSVTYSVTKHLPVSFNPLRGKDKSDLSVNALSSHDYYIKVVPTVVSNDDNSSPRLHAFQYTFAYRDYVQHGHNQRVMPAIWFRYNLSPITVKYTEKYKPFYTFLTAVCAIVGGTFTVAGIIDSAVFTAAEIFKKAELGKLN